MANALQKLEADFFALVCGHSFLQLEYTPWWVLSARLGLAGVKDLVLVGDLLFLFSPGTTFDLYVLAALYKVYDA